MTLPTCWKVREGIGGPSTPTHMSHGFGTLAFLNDKTAALLVLFLSGIGMIVKENKNRIRWTDTYAEQYLNSPPGPPMPAAGDTLYSSTCSTSNFSFSSVASSSFSACSQDDEGFSWIPKSTKDKDAEAVSVHYHHATSNSQRW